MAEEHGFLAHGYGALAAADGDAADGRRGSRAQSGFGRIGGVRALVQRFLPGRQLHREGQAGGHSALAAIGVGKQLEDLKTGQRHVSPPNQESSNLRSRASEAGWRRTRTSAPASISD